VFALAGRKMGRVKFRFAHFRAILFKQFSSGYKSFSIEKLSEAYLKGSSH
jgi:hypothetical protein